MDVTLLFLGSFSVLAAEPLDTAGRIEDFLLAREEGMASRADFHVDVAPVSGASSEAAAAGTTHAHFVVCRMNRCLHDWKVTFLLPAILPEYTESKQLAGAGPGCS